MVLLIFSMVFPVSLCVLINLVKKKKEVLTKLFFRKSTSLPTTCQKNKLFEVKLILRDLFLLQQRKAMPLQ